MSEQIPGNRRRARLLLAAHALVLALLAGAVALLVLGAAAALVAVAVAVALTAGAAAAAPGAARRCCGGAPADPVTHARLHNLVESLCTAAGLPKPTLVVVDDPAPNCLALGRGPKAAVVVVTEGLLRALSRVELEGVLAHELSHVKSLDILPATLAVTLAAPLSPRLPRALLGSRREMLADLGGASLTRYPPALESALQRMREGGAITTSRLIAHLWEVPPSILSPGEPPLAHRIEALAEL